VGSAQWRHEGALLQHGSLLLEGDQRQAVPGVAAVDDAVGEATEAGNLETSSAIGLAELLPDLPIFEELVEAVCSGFEAEVGAPSRPVELSETERSVASKLERVYGSPEWTWNRRRLPSDRPAS
jgi:lipoate-protein ligase A